MQLNLTQLPKISHVHKVSNGEVILAMILIWLMFIETISRLNKVIYVPNPLCTNTVKYHKIFNLYYGHPTVAAGLGGILARPLVSILIAWAGSGNWRNDLFDGSRDKQALKSVCDVPHDRLMSLKVKCIG